MLVETITTPELWLEKFIKSTVDNIKLGLENIAKAAKILQLPKPASYVVTVAGTNGKGSVVKLLEKLYVNLGFNVACYTSPHLIKFNERICINGISISDEEIITAFNKIIKKLNINLTLTYFEFITLAAWYIFTTKQLDVVILEVGLGGRLDAVNIIPKDLAIITAIDYDHQNFLGASLEQIGYEAGIIADNKPVILGDLSMPQVIFNVAKERNATVYQYGIDYSIAHGLGMDIDFNLKSNIKINNIATGLKALSIMLDFMLVTYRKYNIDIIQQTVNNFNLLGRCSWLDKKQSILVDVAHNVQAVKNLKNFLSCLKAGDTEIHAIFGILADKDVVGCLKLMDPIIDYWYLTDIKQPRAAMGRQLADILLTINPHVQYKVYSDVILSYKQAYSIIKQNNVKRIILVIFGSFYIVGPICSYFRDCCSDY